MKSGSDFSCIHQKLISFLDSDDYHGALKHIKENINQINNIEDIALLYINCGFINDKLGDFMSAIESFSRAINYEEKYQFLGERSKDIAYSGRSNSRFKNNDFKGAIEDKRKAKEIVLIENKYRLKINTGLIYYKNIFQGSLPDKDYKYKSLLMILMCMKSKYDLISDYKKMIDKSRKEEIIGKLEAISDFKYIKGDFKGSIKALRRAEKYY